MPNDTLERFYAGETLAAARLMSAVERGGPAAEEILDELYPRTGRAYRIAVTGGSGSGKSTLVNGLTAAYRTDGSTIGVVAEDPSSPFSGGAILGDRIRMSHAIGDPGVFIRSIASRGSETGFSDVATELSDVLDAFGRDVILLETIGVGQLEHRIRFAADTIVVVFTPESGDDVQSLKSGLIEAGDVFVVNKADRPGADRFAREMVSTLDVRFERAPWSPPVVSTVASEEKGVKELADAIARHRAYLDADGRLKAKRRDGLRARIRSIGERKLVDVFWGNPYIEEQFSGTFDAVAAGQLSPYAAAERIVSAMTQGGSAGPALGDSTE